jgi:hypothetical protein
MIETNEDWRACGSLIFKGLSDQRKALNSGIQLLNVLRQQLKTRVKFSCRSRPNVDLIQRKF